MTPVIAFGVIFAVAAFFLLLIRHEAIMSALSDLQDASKANTKAIADLADRVSKIPSGTPDSELVAITAELVAAKAAADAIAPAPAA